MKKVLSIALMLIGITTGGAAQAASMSSSEDLATLPSVTVLAKLEQMRDAIEVSLPIPSHQQFVDETARIVGVLEDGQTPSFQVDDKDSVQQALFSLARTRHFYQGKPSVLNDLNPDTSAQHQIRMLLLGIADQLMARSIYEEEFEKAWEEGVKQGTYTQDFIEELDKSLADFAPSLRIGNSLESLLKEYNSFFDTALQMHHIFPPLINAEKLYGDIIGACGEYRKWIGHGIDSLAHWGRFDTLAEESRESIINLSFLSSPRAFMIPASSDITQTKQEIPSLQYVEDALFDGNHIAVPYNYKSFWHGENAQPLQFVITRPVNEEIKSFLWTNNEFQRGALQKRDHLFLERIRNVYFSNEEEKKPLLESSIEGGERDRLLISDHAQILYNKGSEESLRKARKYFKLAADQGHVESQFNYAALCKNGQGGEKDLITAREYFKKAADQNHPEAQYIYGLMCYDKEGEEKTLQEAREYFKKAADQNHPEAQYIYGAMCYDGKGGEKNFEEARKYFKKAADQDYPEAQYEYGGMCYDGEGGEKDLIAAREYFKKAADHGHIDAQFNYELMCKNG